jgi:hypothetical protein
MILWDRCDYANVVFLYCSLELRFYQAIGIYTIYLLIIVAEEVLMKDTFS